MRYRKYGVAVATAVCMTMLLAGCKEKQVAVPELAKANIETAVVHTSSIADTVDIAAHIESDPTRVVHIYPPLSGRMLNLSVIPGQEVRKGQTIAMLQSGDVAAARSDFEKAKIETLRADHARDRGKLLLEHEVLSQAAYLELVATADAAHSELERARTRIHELGFSETGNSDVAPITSPITGTVLEIGTATGEMQRSLETSAGIATIANLDSVWVVGDVFERDLSLLKRAGTVEIAVQAYPGEVFRGTIANVGDAFDATTHTLKARVVLQNAGHRLKPAMFATLRVQRPASTVILVPAGAVVHDGASTGVYVAGADGKFTLRTVTVGTTRDQQVEVRDGLHDGDRIVKAGAEFMRTPVGD